ncbi:MAG: hypothetical protein IPO27_02940 [Bacteroidetes bacterium]|nr:hypothetical protein [Bacteroidota bacterium]
MISRIKKRFRVKADNDIGFGTHVLEQDRLLNKDGTFNVIRKGIPFFDRFNFYHLLISISWVRFITVLFLGYVFINLAFTVIYFAIDTNEFAGLEYSNAFTRFKELYFFSTQTFTTVGYGRINPVGGFANLVSSVESFTGLLAFALATGLLYGRFSRPKANFRFSENILVAPFNNGTGLMYRVANVYNHQLIDVEAQINFTVIREENGVKARKYFNLPLQLNKVLFFPTSWTVNHVIDESSPLYGMTMEDFIAEEAEFLILMKAFDENFSQSVHLRYSYKHTELKVGAKFTSMMDEPRNGKQVMDFNKLSNTINAPLPLVIDI